MYIILLIGSILALTLCPLVLDAILVRKESRRRYGTETHGSKAASLTLAPMRIH